MTRLRTRSSPNGKRRRGRLPSASCSRCRPRRISTWRESIAFCALPRVTISRSICSAATTWTWGPALIDGHPQTRFVIDHLGFYQPRTKPAPANVWADLPKVLELARRPNAAIKVSGVCTMSREPFPYPDIWDPLARVFDAWGFERCLWGTDWTRTFSLVNYEQGVEPFRLTDRLNDSERAMLMGPLIRKILPAVKDDELRSSRVGWDLFTVLSIVGKVCIIDADTHFLPPDTYRRVTASSAVLRREGTARKIVRDPKSRAPWSRAPRWRRWSPPWPPARRPKAMKPPHGWPGEPPEPRCSAGLIRRGAPQLSPRNSMLPLSWGPRLT